MRRILFTWRGLRVWSHPALLYAGLVAGVLGQQAAARAAALPAVRSYVALLLLIPVALAGNRLAWAATHPTRPSWRQALRRRGGGGVMYGGLPLILLASLVLLPALQVPVARFWDSAVFAILPALIGGRLGCLLNGCCQGAPAAGRLTMLLPDVAGRWARRHPTQLLEAGAAAALLAGAALAGPARQAPGALFLETAAAYAAVRLALQPLREHRLRLRGVDLSAAASLVLLVVSLSGLLLVR